MVVVLAVTASATYLFMPYISGMLTNSGALRKNFRGEAVPTGMGVIFIPVVLMGSIIMLFIYETDTQLVLINALAASVMGFVGIVDDLLGKKNIKGFRGHIRCLLEGNLTTGGLKAVVGGLAAAAISAVISSNLLEGLLNTFMIAMFTNLLNLLDLRPGRAIKSFFFIWGILYTFLSVRGYGYILAPLAGSLAAYLPVDIKRKGMMGDAGSNVLGVVLGLYCCLGTQMHQKAVILLLLVLLQLASEKYSFTKVIYRNRVLRYMDALGTGGAGKYDD